MVNHEAFQAGDATTSFLDNTPELFEFTPRKDRATKLLTYLGEIIVNGNPEVAGKAEPASLPKPRDSEVNGGDYAPGRASFWTRWGPRNSPSGRIASSGCC